MSLQPRQNYVCIVPDPLPVLSAGIFIQITAPNHRTGTIKSFGPDVKWHLVKEGRRVLYIQRNCVEVEDEQLVNFENIAMEVDKDVFFSREEITPENKIKVHLVRA